MSLYTLSVFSFSRCSLSRIVRVVVVMSTSVAVGTSLMVSCLIGLIFLLSRTLSFYFLCKPELFLVVAVVVVVVDSE